MHLTLEQAYLCRAPRGWFTRAIHLLTHHKLFKHCNTHIPQTALNALIKHNTWPTSHQVFSPYSPSSAGYTQVVLQCPALPAMGGGPKAKKFKKNHKLHFSWHVLLTIYKMRFLDTPTCSSTELEAAFASGYQASHMMGNIPMASMGINPFFMTLEPGVINRSRYSCTLQHAFDEFKASKGMNLRRSDPHHLHKNFMHNIKPAVSTLPTTHTLPFTCVLPDTHRPPCLGWDFAKHQIPEAVQSKWDKHMLVVQQNIVKKQEGQAKRQAMTTLQQLRSDITTKKKELAKLEDRVMKAERMKRGRSRARQ